MKDTLVSVVVPAFNEERCLPEFHRRLCRVLGDLDTVAEIIYVNDGSRDGTLAELRALHAADDRVTVIDLSRNFGKEIALTAGIDHALGDAVIVIDADLQDPPELIPELVRSWRAGHDVVYGTRVGRDGEPILKRASAHVFYRLLRRLGRVNNVMIPEDTGDFRLLSRRAVDALMLLREQHRYMKGLYAWVGYSQHGISYRRGPRYAGTSKWNYRGLWNFAVEGLTSFSRAPLQIATFLGLTVAATAFLYGGWIIAKTLLFGEAVQGFPTLMVTILFLGGTQLVAIGILGEYVGRMFDESKKRPLYLVANYLPRRSNATVRVRAFGRGSKPPVVSTTGDD